MSLIAAMCRRFSTASASTTTTNTTLGEFGVFKKRLEAIFENPALLPTLPHAITSQDLDAIGSSTPLRTLLQLEQQTTQGVHFRRALRHFAISFFARAKNDTGSPEVQIALSTVRMAWLQRHMSDGQGKHHKDFKTERALKQCEEERRKMLRYLRRLSLERFYQMLDKLGLPNTYIEQAETRYPFNYDTPKQFKTPKNRTVRRQ